MAPCQSGGPSGSTRTSHTGAETELRAFKNPRPLYSAESFTELHVRVCVCACVRATSERAGDVSGCFYWPNSAQVGEQLNGIQRQPCPQCSRILRIASDAGKKQRFKVIPSPPLTSAERERFQTLQSNAIRTKGGGGGGGAVERQNNKRPHEKPLPVMSLTKYALSK